MKRKYTYIAIIAALILLALIIFVATRPASPAPYPDQNTADTSAPANNNPANGETTSPSATPTADSPIPSPSPTATTATTPVPTPTPTAAPQPTAQPTTTGNSPGNLKNVSWGMYTSEPSDFSQIEKDLQATMDIEAVFVGWGSDGDFPAYMSSTTKASGKTLLIYWEQYGTTLDDIIGGKEDNYIKQFAASAQAYGGRIILVPFHEMNGNWDPWDGPVGNNSATKVIAAWRHLHDQFASVSNVKWGWAVNNESVPDTTANQLENYYPGDVYVDYVGVDGFNFGQPWQNAAQVFDNTLRRLQAFNKPIYIFSMASAAGPNKASWITEALTTEISKWHLAGWVWFNENKEENWLYNSSPEALTAFRSAVANY